MMHVSPSNLPFTGDGSASASLTMIPPLHLSLHRGRQRSAGPSNQLRTLSGTATAAQDGHTQHGYISELQESIRVIQVHLKLEIPPDAELSLAVRSEGATEVHVSSSAHGWEAVVPLPGPAVASVGRVITAPSGAANLGSVASFRLSSSPATSAAATSLPSDPPLSAPELAALEPACLACTTCATPIVDTAAVVRLSGFKDLPSEHWEELVGSWLCHDEMKLALGASGEEGESAPLEGNGGNGFWPKESEVLVGSNYVLVQGALLIGGEQNTSRTWRVRVGSEVSPHYISFFRLLASLSSSPLSIPSLLSTWTSKKAAVLLSTDVPPSHLLSRPLALPFHPLEHPLQTHWPSPMPSERCVRKRVKGPLRRVLVSQRTHPLGDVSILDVVGESSREGGEDECVGSGGGVTGIEGYQGVTPLCADPSCGRYKGPIETLYVST